MSRLPLIGATVCNLHAGDHAYRAIVDRPALVQANAGKVIPMMVPSSGSVSEPSEMAVSFNRQRLIGSPLRSKPYHYSGPGDVSRSAHDRESGRTTLPLIVCRVVVSVPLSGICEYSPLTNAAFERSRHERVHETERFMEYRDAASLAVSPCQAKTSSTARRRCVTHA